MKELLLGLVGAAVVAAAFVLGRASFVEQRPAEQTVRPLTIDPGLDGSVSIYNPDGRLLKSYGVKGSIERLPTGELVFEAADGRRVRTNATYIIEGQTAAGSR